MYSGLIYQYSTQIVFIHTDYGITNNHQKWWVNGVLKTVTVDYSETYNQFGISTATGFSPFNSGDIITLQIFNDSSFTTLLATGTATVLPLFSYLETYSPNSNGVLSSDIIDKSLVLNTPLIINKCSEMTINGHITNNFTINNINTSGTFLSYTTGQFQLDGVNLITGDIQNQNLQAGTFSFGSGLLTHNADNISLQFFKSTNTHTFKYTHNASNSKEDFGFSINSFGFSKIGSDNVLDGYKIVQAGIAGSLLHAPTNSSVFEIVISPTSYILKVDSVIVYTRTRDVAYTTTVGTTLSGGASLPILTNDTYKNNNTSGSGYIQAIFDGSIIARQLVTIANIPAPLFSVTSINSICPSTSINLASLSLTNDQSGFTLKWYSNIALGDINLLSNLVVSTSGTYYAAFENNTEAGCYSLIRSFVVTIVDCTNSINDSVNVNSGDSILINFATNDILCNNSGDTTFTISTNPNILHGNLSGLNTTLGTVTFNSVEGYIGTATFTYNIRCLGVIKDTSTVTVNILGYCNERIVYTVLKNNCSLGIPTTISYTVLENTLCNGYSSQAEANWEAYSASLVLSQAQANLDGECLTCGECVQQPCVVICRFQKFTVTVVPHNLIRVYNGSNILIYEVESNDTGIVTVEIEFTGEFYVTQVNSQGTESVKQCVPYIMDEECPILYEDDCHC